MDFIFFFQTLVVSNVVFHDFLQVVLDSIGVSIWQMAAQPCSSQQPNLKPDSMHYENGHANHTNSSDSEDESSDSGSEDDDDSVELYEDHVSEDSHIAFACDDGCVRIYSVSSLEDLMYKKSLPRISGEKAATYSSKGFLCFCFGYMKVTSHVCRENIKCHLES